MSVGEQNWAPPVEFKKPRDCSCQKCIQACKTNPGWMTPIEAQKAVDAGHSEKLMLDWWESDERIYLLSPAGCGCEGGSAPDFDWFTLFSGAVSKGRCQFLSSDEKCEIHGTDFKPTECRAALICENFPLDYMRIRESIADQWDTECGRDLIERWKVIVNF